MKKKITKIVLTGGPCGGKTTALAYLRQKLEDKGYIVFIVPESATLCINGGIDPRNALLNQSTIQSAIIEMTMRLEDVFVQSAEKTAHDKDIVIIYDRGITDARAYSEDHSYNEALKSLDMHWVQARDQRYDAVIHLRTVAYGKEEYYTLANNTARYEKTPALAREQDEKTLNAWVGHQHLRIIDNSTSFDKKIRRVYIEVCAVLGIPVPIEKERKFLVRYDRSNIPAHAQHILIEQAYTRLNEKEEIRIRKRGQGDYFTFYQTIKKPGLRPSERFETEQIITAREYAFGMSMALPDLGIVHKERTCFVHKEQYWELDTFDDKRVLEGRADGLLELELTPHRHKVYIPEWIEVVDEVTDNPHFKNSYFAKKLAVV